MSRIVDVTEKAGRSGPLVFVVVRHEIRNRDGVALIEHHDIGYRDNPPRREPDPARGSAMATAAPGFTPPGDVRAAPVAPVAASHEDAHALPALRRWPRRRRAADRRVVTLTEWIGRTESATDTVTEVPVAALSATLDRDDPAPRGGDPLPLLVAASRWRASGGASRRTSRRTSGASTRRLSRGIVKSGTGVEHREIIVPMSLLGICPAPWRRAGGTRRGEVRRSAEVSEDPIECLGCAFRRAQTLMVIAHP